MLLASQMEIVLATLPGDSPTSAHSIGGAVLAGVVHGFTNGLTIQESARWAAAYAIAALRNGGLANTHLTDIQNLLPKIDVRLFNVM